MKIQIEDNYFFVNEKIVSYIKDISQKNKEKIGYLFYKRISNTNEFVVDWFTPFHEKDVSKPCYCKTSHTHKRTAKNIVKNSKVGFIGFWHTHPNGLSSYPSNIDFDEFERISRKNKYCIFLIGSIESIRYMIYIDGRLLGKAEIKWIDMIF